MSAAAVAKGCIKVYTVGVGSGGVVPVPLPGRDPITGQTVIQRRLMNVPVDELLLREIARRTGQFFKATDREGLLPATIDRLGEDAAAGQALCALPRGLPDVRLGRPLLPPAADAGGRRRGDRRAMSFALPRLWLILRFRPGGHGAGAVVSGGVWRGRGHLARGLWDRLLPAYAPRRIHLSIACLMVAVLGIGLGLPGRAGGATPRRSSGAGWTWCSWSIPRCRWHEGRRRACSWPSRWSSA